MKLWIDSSTNDLYLALMGDDKTVCYVRNGKNDHSETLVDYLDAFLKEHHVDVDQIEDIFIGRGPGSYTGLRIAGTVGKVLAYVKHKNFYSFSSLDLLLASAMHQDGKFLAKIVAKKHSSYVKAIVISSGIIQTTLEECFLDDVDLVAYQDYTILDLSMFQTGKATLVEELFARRLFQTEDLFTYVPNYIRSVM